MGRRGHSDALRPRARHHHQHGHRTGRDHVHLPRRRGDARISARAGPGRGLHAPRPATRTPPTTALSTSTFPRSNRCAPARIRRTTSRRRANLKMCASIRSASAPAPTPRCATFCAWRPFSREERWLPPSASPSPPAQGRSCKCSPPAARVADILASGARVLECAWRALYRHGLFPPIPAASPCAPSTAISRAAAAPAMRRSTSPRRKLPPASAILGHIADPRELGTYPEVQLPERFTIDDSGVLLPADPEEAKSVEGRARPQHPPHAAGRAAEGRDQRAPDPQSRRQHHHRPHHARRREDTAVPLQRAQALRVLLHRLR